MGARTNAVLTALSYYLNNRMKQEDEQRQDRRKLEYLKNEYIQKHNLRNEYEPEAVAAELAKNKQIANEANLYNDNFPEISKQYADNLAFLGKYKPMENEYKLNELQNKQNLMPHQYDYDLVKLRTGIDKMLAQPELDAKKQEYEDKLNSIKLNLWNQKYANEKARGDKIKALGSLSAAGGGKGGVGLNDDKELRYYLELYKNALKDLADMDDKARAAGDEGYQNKPTYKDAAQNAQRIYGYIKTRWPNFNPQDPEAVNKVLKEATDIGGAEGNIDKAVAGGASTSTSSATATGGTKEAAIKAAIPPKKEGYDERGILGYIDDSIADKEKNIRYNRAATKQRLNSRTADYYKTDKPYGWTGKYGRDIYNAIRRTRDSLRQGVYNEETIPTDYIPLINLIRGPLLFSQILGF